MPTITLVTIINAPVQTVFDLARSIDMHRHSMAHTNEKPVAGRLSGLIEDGGTVTREARYFFKTPQAYLKDLCHETAILFP